MNRRGFLGLLARGAVGVCVVAKIPTALLPAQVRTRAACEFLRKAYNDFHGGRMDRMPREMYAGRELYDAYEGELAANERFGANGPSAGGFRREGLMFKGVMLRPEGRGWTVRIV